MSQHTPGPWEVAHEPTGFAIVGPLPDRFVVAHVPMHANDRTVTADAQLVAAAPELLGACRAAQAYDSAVKRHAGGRSWVTSDELDRLYDDWIAKARAAVAKAEGKEPAP